MRSAIPAVPAIAITYPEPLRPGARIAVTAPSSGVPARLQARLDLNLAHLRAQGFVVDEGVCLRDQQRGASAAAAARAAELMRLLLRDDIDAVFPPWGGELAIELLDRLDWPALARARPKWLIGFSDTSTLMLPITLRLGWATAHGPCLMDLAPTQGDPLTTGALQALATPDGASVVQRQSARWQSVWGDFEREPEVAFALTEPTAWRCLNRPPDAQVSMTGHLIGGCLDTLVFLAGTPHGEVPGFVRQNADTTGTLLFLENSDQTAAGVARVLQRLRWAGWFNGLAGVLIGRSNGPVATGSEALQDEDALADALSQMPCPVLFDVDIGHRPPQLMLMQGAVATVQWSAASGGQLTQRRI
ncbi:MAG: S66 peptidase family protein [Rubrivivax sp.]